MTCVCVVYPRFRIVKARVPYCANGLFTGVRPIGFPSSVTSAPRGTLSTTMRLCTQLPASPAQAAAKATMSADRNVLGLSMLDLGNAANPGRFA